MEPARSQSVPMDAHALESLRGKSILVTGAGGSIGSQLCSMIATVADKLTLVSISESGLYKVQKLLRDAPCEVVGILCDYGDSIHMNHALENVDIVIHAGAHKHVPICEANPIAAIMNNVWGTQKLIRAAVAAGVKQFIQISTDKAVEPTSIMGATKRACELMCLRRSYAPMIVSVVRFGNVVGSDGSVIPLWREQIKAGGPVTLTDRRCTRFFMTIEDACRLILAVVYMREGGLYVLDMGEAVRMEDVATRLIQQINPGGDIEIVETGLRPGEKLVEELTYGGDTEPTKHPKVKKIIEPKGQQPSHQYIPDMVEHARRNRPAEAIEFLWRVVNEAFRQ